MSGPLSCELGHAARGVGLVPGVGRREVDERIVLDERGTVLTTAMLSGWVRQWMEDGVSPCFIIGSRLMPPERKRLSRIDRSRRPTPVPLSHC